MKKRLIIISSSLMAVLAVLCIVIYLSLNIKIIGDSDINLTIYHDYFENGYKASLFSKPYDNVEVTNLINNQNLGDYTITYKTKFLFISKSITRTVHVVDDEAPIINLVGDEHMYLEYGEKYEELGCSAIDNFDGDITNKVIITGNVDDAIGKYDVKYEITDEHGNYQTKTRIVEIIDINLLSANVEDFWMEGFYDDITLKPDEKEYDYFKDTVFVGDSNTLYLHYRGKVIDAKQTWGRINLNIAGIRSTKFKTIVDGQDRYIQDAIDTYKPKYLIVAPGINCAIDLEQDYYISELIEFIKYMRENNPDIHFAFTSILPIRTGTLDLEFQKTINRYNYYLAQVCHEYKVNFINFSDEVRNDEGYAKQEYFACLLDNDCGFHLNEDGMQKYIDYIKHLDLERVPE